MLLIYPVVILARNDVYGMPAFYNTLGWLSAFAIEGADFAIAIFAIHFALLIFVPSWKWQNRSTGNMEGGLYRMRHSLYPVTFLVPMILASLAFVGFNTFIPVNLNDRVVLDNDSFNFSYQARKGGYKALSAWCYLPPYPVWYRICLSWGPRYFILVLIMFIYVSIYIFVSKENRKIKNQIGSFKSKDSLDIHRARDSMGRILTLQQRLLIYLKFFYRKSRIPKIMSALGNFFFLSLEDYRHEDLTERESSDQALASLRRANGDDVTARVASDLNSNYIPLSLARRNVLSSLKASNKRFSCSCPTLPRYRLQRRGGSVGNLRTACSSAGSTRRHSVNVSAFGDSVSTTNVFEPPHQLSNEEPNWNKALGVPSRVGSKNSQSGLTAYPKTNMTSSSLQATNSFERSFNFERQQNSTNLSPVRSVASNRDSSFRTAPVRLKNTTSRTLTRLNADPDDPDVIALDTNHLNGVKQNFQSETYQEFKKRRAQIQKQMRAIFIYPFSYILIWTFPLAVDVIQYRYEIVHGPVVWLEYIATFMQPLSCFVDVMVFIYRERPSRHSWASITKNELLNTYSLKGELGEQKIRELCNSELGKKGWYYRGRWTKLGCWRYKPQRWKRVAWFIYRFVKGFVKNNYDFSDNCYDATYWEAHYTGKSPSENMGSSNMRCSEALKEILDVNNTRKDSYFSGSTSEYLYENSGFVKVPLKWRILHCLPMLEGVDLDELEYQLRTSNNSGNFEIPGLSLAVNNFGKNKNEDNSNSFFKPDYNMTNTSAGGPKSPSARPQPVTAKHSSSSSSSPLHSLIYEGSGGRRRFSSAIFGDDSRNNFTNSSQDQDINEEDSSGKQLGLMDFLKG